MPNIISKEDKKRVFDACKMQFTAFHKRLGISVDTGTKLLELLRLDSEEDVNRFDNYTKVIKPAEGSRTSRFLANITALDFFEWSRRTYSIEWQVLADMLDLQTVEMFKIPEVEAKKE